VVIERGIHAYVMLDLPSHRLPHPISKLQTDPILAPKKILLASMKNKNGDAIHNILNYPDDERQK